MRGLGGFRPDARSRITLCGLGITSRAVIPLGRACRFLRPHAEREGQEGRQGRPRGRHPPKGESGGGQRAERRQEGEDPRAIGKGRLHALARLLVGQAGEIAGVDRAEGGLRGAGGGEGHIPPAAGVGDGAEGGFRQAAAHGLAVVGQHGGAVGDGGALRGANAHGEDGDAAAAGFLGHGLRAPGQIFAVADEHDGPMLFGVLPQRFQTFGDGVGQVGLAGRGAVGGQCVDALPEEGGVGGHRAEKGALPAEGQQTRAVAAQGVHKVNQVGLRAAQSVGADILRQHGARHVHRQHHPAPAGGHLFHPAPPARPGQSHHAKDKGAQQKPQLRGGARRHALRVARQARHPFRRPPPPHGGAPNQKRHGRQQQKPKGV